jgi:prophage regulatory protein
VLIHNETVGQASPFQVEEHQMAQLPETGFLRLTQIIGNPKANPPIPPLIPVKKSSWWAGVKASRYPQGVKLAPRITAWRVEDIKELIERLGGK